MKNSNRLYKLPIRSIVPNALTILSLSAGLAGLKYGFLGMWEASVIAILIAGILDGLDGRVARMLKGATNFGAELDSLVDFVNFGVVPAMVMYMWVLKDIKGVGWFFALLFAVCMVLRLARFNTMSKDELTDKELSKEFFTGVPAPAAAALALWPMILHFETGFDLFKNPWVCIVYMGFMAFLTVSTLPTFSFKTVKVKKEHVLFYLIGVAAVATMLLNFAWITLSVIGSLYLGLMPVAYFSMQKKLKAQAEAKKP
jgi:CDP-diacylglycerol--serine O-phosphatidyltransferase